MCVLDIERTLLRYVTDARTHQSAALYPPMLLRKRPYRPPNRPRAEPVCAIFPRGLPQRLGAPEHDQGSVHALPGEDSAVLHHLDTRLLRLRECQLYTEFIYIGAHLLLRSCWDQL